MGHDYDLVVIGGGAAGLVAVVGGAALGARTCLVEKDRLGGDCTLYGCVPSKTLLRAAHVLSLAKRLKDFGISSPNGAEYDTSGVMSHVRGMISKVEGHHPPKVFEEKGIKVLFGSPCFVDNHTIELDGKRITSKRFILATGSEPVIPPIEGIEDTKYLTNETVFDLEMPPEALAVLGGGPIGVEMAQAFARLGTRVCIIEMAERLLFKEDEEVAKVLSDSLAAEGIGVHAGKKVTKFSKENGMTVVTMTDKKGKESVEKAGEVLIALGRKPSVEGLCLEKAGVKYSKHGIEADATLRTSAKNIYASGDAVGPYQFSHMAEYQAVIAVGNALFPFKRKVDYSAVPWCTFTDPEVAHLGFTEQEARKKYGDIKVYKAEYNGNDRAVTDLEEKGLAKVVCDKKGRILGAHIVGASAGELIHEYVLAKSAGLKIGSLSSAIHVYPTLAQVVKRSADQYYTDMLSSGWFKVLNRIMLKFLR